MYLVNDSCFPHDDGRPPHIVLLLANRSTAPKEDEDANDAANDAANWR